MSPLNGGAGQLALEARVNQPAVNADNFFDGVGEKGAPSFKFNGVGTGVKGTVVDQYSTFVTEPGSREPKTYPDGNPIPQLNVTIQTELRDWKGVAPKSIPKDDNGNPKPPSEDDGTRRIYVKYQMRNAVGKALKDVNVRALEKGGVLAVKQVGEQDQGKANPLPIYEARYTAPKPEDSFFDGSGEDQGSDPWAVGGNAGGTGPAQPTTQSAPSAQTAPDDEPPF